VAWTPAATPSMADRAGRPVRPGRARRTVALAALVAALGLTGAVACGDPPTASGKATTGHAVVRADATPKSLEVPSIGVHVTGLVHLGLTPEGKMEVPKDAVTAGWYGLGPVPGEPGPAVIAAHVNYNKVAGVFARLHEVAVGDAVTVTRADGQVLAFTAYRVERYPKATFPTQDVYGNTDGPELRLVTCGGDFDRAAHSYRDNIVVFARKS
jgi:Sortase domain